MPYADEVVQILRVGPPGLVFLFALLAYRLLARELARKQDARPNVLASIRHYQYWCFASAVLAVVGPALLPAPRPDTCLLWESTVKRGKPTAFGPKNHLTVAFLSAFPPAVNLRFSFESDDTTLTQGHAETISIGGETFQVIANKVEETSASLSLCR